MGLTLKEGLDVGSSLLGLGLTMKENHKNRRLSREQFAAQMDQSVQRRVEDARKAGVHPLFALGASVGASPTTSFGGSGGAISAAVRNLGEAIARSEIRRNDAGAKKDEAEAALADSKTATIAQRLSAEGRDAHHTTYPTGGHVVSLPRAHEDWVEGPVFGPPEFYNPEVPVSMPGDPSVEAGIRPAYVKYRRADGSVGTAFGSGIPGAEDLNQVWIPLQNWWHTSKVFRNRVRKNLGLTDRLYYRMREDPTLAAEFIRRNKHRLEKRMREWRNFKKATSGRPVR